MCAHTETSPGKILEQKEAHSKNYAPGCSISLFKFLKGKLPGSRIAEFLDFRRPTKRTNCRKWLRIAGNCLRIAIRIAELPSELPGSFLVSQYNYPELSSAADTSLCAHDATRGKLIAQRQKLQCSQSNWALSNTASASWRRSHRRAASRVCVSISAQLCCRPPRR